MKIAVMTMVKNESIFLPIWGRHYGRNFGYENLFVIDNGSDDGGLEALPIHNKLRVTSDKFDDFIRAEFVNNMQNALIKYYDIVIFVDVDEIICVDPALNVSLNQYLEKNISPTLSPIGLNVIHNRDAGEKDLDLSLPLFSQRRFVQFDAQYCKPSITSHPVRWGPGFHGLVNEREHFDPNLFIFHLRAFDENLSMKRFETLSKTSLSENMHAKLPNPHFNFSPDKYKSTFFNPTSGFNLNNSDKFDFSSKVETLTYSIPSIKNNIKNVFGSKYNKKFVKKFRMEKSIHYVPDRFIGSIELS
jgi:Glycosyl transferase family 2